MHEKVSFNGWPNCIRMFNDEIELIVTTDIGPRIVRFGFINQQNFFYLVPEHMGQTGGTEWRIYGGHRLFIAPEEMPRSYSPDNDKVEFSVFENRVRLIQPKESLTGIVKEMEITLMPQENKVIVLHRLINEGPSEISLAAWSLSALAPGGRAIIPQEPYGDGDDYLLPARPLVLWHFTKMNDPRWIWGARYIQAKQIRSETSEQKIGVLNKQGWTAYALNGELLIKKFDYSPEAVYTDYGCNNETYINGEFLEMETLGPLTKLLPGKAVEHIEHWYLTKASIDEDEASIDANILPLVTKVLKC